MTIESARSAQKAPSWKLVAEIPMALGSDEHGLSEQVRCALKGMMLRPERVARIGRAVLAAVEGLRDAQAPDHEAAPGCIRVWIESLVAETISGSRQSSMAAAQSMERGWGFFVTAGEITLGCGRSAGQARLVELFLYHEGGTQLADSTCAQSQGDQSSDQ